MAYRRSKGTAAMTKAFKDRNRSRDKANAKAMTGLIGFAGAASLMSGSRFENGAAHRGGPVGRRGRLGEGSVRRVPGRLLNKMGFSPTLRQWGGGHKNR